MPVLTKRIDIEASGLTEPPADRRPTRLAMLSHRSKILSLLALLAWLVVISISLADPNALRKRTLLAMLAVSAVAGIAALLSLAADVVAARRAEAAGYWGGWIAAFDAIRSSEPDTGSDNVIDLSARRPRRRRAAAREADAEPALPAAPVARRHIAAFALVALLLVGLTGSALWQLSDMLRSQPSTALPPFATPSASGTSVTSTAAASATPSAGQPGAGKSTHPSQPTGQPSTAPSTAPAADPPSTDPIGDGTYRVGVDIAPGMWSSGGAVNLTLSCSYRINNGATAKAPLSVGPVTVQLHTGDTFTTGGCKPWRYSA